MRGFQTPNLLIAKPHHFLLGKIEISCRILLNGSGFAKFGWGLIPKIMEFPQESPNLTVRGFRFVVSNDNYQLVINLSMIPTFPQIFSPPGSCSELGMLRFGESGENLLWKNAGSWILWISQVPASGSTPGSVFSLAGS